jgi:hypothetical protein
MKMTRRTLLGSAALAAAAAQTPPAPVDYLTISTEANKRNADSIAKVTLPQATEPAFVFKA